MPPTRREQLELDELLSDIYRGIETLPDKTRYAQANTNNHYNATSNVSANSNKSSNSNSNNLFSRTYVKEYELPASSPIVRQHKQELAATLRSNSNNSYSASPAASTTATASTTGVSSKQPQRSTLKRHTNTPDQSTSRQPQSLASFVTSTTPENKRRVRIVDHPDKLAKGYIDDDYYSAAGAAAELEDQQDVAAASESLRRPTKVKYVNTNKLIYHQERNPDDENNLSDEENSNAANDDNNDNNSQPDDDIDGVSRVEYYHTTWLDRQLGRASKRRSSKELNERQVKEKAMIEELKRSLKNGAITLRQSFKGKNRNNNNNNSNKSKPSETFDDQILNTRPPSRQKESSSSVFGSGLATLPRRYHQQHESGGSFLVEPPSRQQERKLINNSGFRESPNTPKQTKVTPTAAAAPNTSDYTLNAFDSKYESTQMQTRQPELPQQQQQQQFMQQNQSDYSSKTLPHNYNSNRQQLTPKRGEHQLLQSHYRSGNKDQHQQQFNTIGGNSTRQTSLTPTTDNMRQLNYTYNSNKNAGNTNNCAPNSKYNTLGARSPISNNQLDHQEQHPQLGNTISSLPSASEVVRSALSRSSSQVSINQLNKTINLLPNSPPPFAPSPMTPTQNLKAATPSLTPSPAPYHRQNSDLVNYNRPAVTQANQYSKTPYSYQDRSSAQQQQQQQQQQQPIVLHGTRTIERAPQQQQSQQQQTTYANPHASLMQHRIDQQMKQPSRNNGASIREFNELDSLLRSLSPGVTTHVTPGYTSRPSQPAFGYGLNPTAQSQQQQQPIGSAGVQNPRSDIYAKVQKQPQVVAQSNPTKPNTTNYLQQHYGPNLANNSNLTTSQPYTIDVTNKKDDNCLRHQDLSEFEPPIELLPSMEDYQNISKLNPVKNHYWYKPNMSRDRAISLLKDKPQGTFIVRDSTSFRGAYGLAVKVAKLPKNVLRNPNNDPSSELIRHFLIEPTGNGVRLKGYANESVYSNLANLIYQHSLTEIALPCKLVIPRADIEDENFNRKQKQFYDDFIVSKEQAKHNPYDRTSPNGGYRKYPGDVYVHNEHRIIFE